MSKHFTFAEMLHSSTAAAHGIANIPEEVAVYVNLGYMAEQVLEKARARMGHIPIYVNSGYRCEKLNKMVGGAAKSNHLYGKAVDLTTRSKEKNEKLFEVLTEMKKKKGGCIRELIWEGGGEWIHVSIY